MPVYDDAALTRLRSEFDRYAEKVGRERSAFGLQNLHFEHQFAWELATQPGLLDAIESVIGPDIALYNVRFLCKYGDDDGFFTWHQDLAYYGIDPPEAVVAFVALDDSTKENGCLEVIPGSHLNGVVRHRFSGRAGNVLRADQEVPHELIDAERAVALEQPAGTASLHDARLFHASRPNLSGRRRCGIQIGYVGPHVRESADLVDQPIPEGWRWRPFPAVLVRGEDRYGNLSFREQPFPLPSADRVY